MPSKSYKQVKKELLKDARSFKFKNEKGPGFPVARKFVQKRIELKMTQLELAIAVHTSQAAISAFESGASNPTIGFLFKLAHALEAELNIHLS